MLALAIGTGTEALSVGSLFHLILGCKSRYAKRGISKKSGKVVMSDE